MDHVEFHLEIYSIQQLFLQRFTFRFRKKMKIRYLFPLPIYLSVFVASAFSQIRVGIDDIRRESERRAVNVHLDGESNLLLRFLQSTVLVYSNYANNYTF